MTLLGACLVLFSHFIVSNFAIHQCCQDPKNGLILEHADYRTCQKCPVVLLSGQSVKLRCRPEGTLTEKNIASKFIWMTNSDPLDADEHVLMKTVESISKSGSYSERTFVVTTKNDVDVATFCRKKDENSTDSAYLEFKICANLSKPELNCITYPSESEQHYLLVDCNWKVPNSKTKKICTPNYSKAKYSLSEEGGRTSNQLHHLKLNDQNSCKKGSCQSSICIQYKSSDCLNEIEPSIRKNNLTILITAELASYNGKEILQSFNYSYVFDLKSIYRQNFEPVIDSCESKRCQLHVLTPIHVFFVLSTKTPTVFEFESKVTDLNFTDKFELKTNSTFFNDSVVHSITFAIDNLLPYRFYKFEIKYRTLPSKYFSDLFVVYHTTPPAAPEIKVESPPGAYLTKENQLILLWETTPLVHQYGPSFTYVIQESDVPVLSSVSKLQINFIKNETVFRLTCRNSEGFCPNETLITVNKLCQGPQFVEAVVNTATDRMLVQWSPSKDALNYTVFWCRANSWINCDHGLQWANVSSQLNEHSIPIPNFARFVFGTSTCYESGCSSIKEASMYEPFESTTLNIDATNEKNKILIKFDSSDRFINYFHVVVNSSSLVHLNTISEENQIRLFCHDINFVKAVSVQVIAYRIVNDQTYKSKTLSQSVNTHCEKPNLSFVGQIFTALVSLLLPLAIIAGLLYWRMIVNVKKVIDQFETMLNKLNQKSEYKEYLETKSELYMDALQWFNNTFRMTWQECDQKLRTTGHVYFDCPNYLIFTKNAEPNATSSDGPSTEPFAAGSSFRNNTLLLKTPASDIQDPSSVESIRTQSDNLESSSADNENDEDDYEDETNNLICPTNCDSKQDNYPTETSQKRFNDKNYVAVDGIVDPGTHLHKSPAGYAVIVKDDMDNPENNLNITPAEQSECYETPVDKSGYGQVVKDEKEEEEKLLPGTKKIEKN